MATTQHDGLLTYKDEAGNLKIMYPATRAENVLMESGDTAEEALAAATAALEGKADKQTESGGFVAGQGATATTGGVAIGKNTSATYGGFAGGENASVSTYGAALGCGATSNRGGAVGHEAVCTATGGAVGAATEAYSGFAGGYLSKTRAGAAIGFNAKTIDLNNEGIDAIQLGTGTNNNEKTMQVYDKQVVAYDGSASAVDDKWYLKDVGKLSALATSVKTSIVNAINSLKTLLDTHTGNTTVHVTSTEKSTWNGKANASHTHGNVTSDGKIGTAANKAVYTGTNGVLQAGTLPVSAGGTGATSAGDAPFLAKAGGFMTGPLQAHNPSTLDTPYTRNIQIGQNAPGSLTTGVIYLQYE